MVTTANRPTAGRRRGKLNRIGLEKGRLQGQPVSTLCQGCGHDSISSQIIAVAYELSLPPHRIIKMSGIGCSSKSPAYFLNRSHGFNALHGRMPSVATGATLANRDLMAIARQRRRRHRQHRPRPVQAPAAPQRADGLYHREQRRLRPDQGPVLGHRRHGPEAEVRRHQRAAADRPLPGSADRRLRLRGALASPATPSRCASCSRRRSATTARPCWTSSARA